jgi:hypothetical protein
MSVAPPNNPPALAASLALAATAHGAASDLDSGFGANGIATATVTPIGADGRAGGATTIQVAPA